MATKYLVVHPSQYLMTEKEQRGKKVKKLAHVPKGSIVSMDDAVAKPLVEKKRLILASEANKEVSLSVKAKKV